MFKRLKENNRLDEAMFLDAISVLCLFLLVFRCVYTDTTVFLFLIWNLFLAFLPWLFSTLLIIYPKLQKNRFAVVSLVFAWLLFFPNAPYMLTDLLHLRLKTTMPVWFDLVLFLSFAWVGLLFGFFSLWDIEKILVKKINKKFIALISLGLLFLGSFGIYLGRFLRWNSWDIIKQPFNLLIDVLDRLLNPFTHPRTWGMTLLMFFFLSMLYWSFRFIKKRID